MFNNEKNPLQAIIMTLKEQKTIRDGNGLCNKYVFKAVDGGADLSFQLYLKNAEDMELLDNLSAAMGDNITQNESHITAIWDNKAKKYVMFGNSTEQEFYWLDESTLKEYNGGQLFLDADEVAQLRDEVLRGNDVIKLDKLAAKYEAQAAEDSKIAKAIRNQMKNGF